MFVRHAAALLAGILLFGASATAAPVLDPAALPKVGSVSPRFLSYNIEMVELTGGRFWRPYGSPGNERFEDRPPLNLRDEKLRRLASALGPAYVRYSGSWANATWFGERKAATGAPDGFDTVLTRAQWRDAVEFARASNATIVTSFATSMGTRDADGAWQPVVANDWIAFTKSIGGQIAAAEFANEPNMAWLLKGPKGYSGVDYRRDYATFARWLRKASPDTLLLAPGISEMGEPERTLMRQDPATPFLENDALLALESPRPDAFTFHFYGGGSARCGGQRLGRTLTTALSPDWLEAIDPALERVAALRDAQAPGAPLWNTESGETACGGNPWAATFADTFRFIDVLGRSARAGVKVFIHNTLAASDYALLDEATHVPRPNYWAALLWKRTMGTTVLASPPSPAPQLRLHAHCLAGKPGGVGLVVINIGEDSQSVVLKGGGVARTLTATTIDSKTITVNGRVPSIALRGFSGLDGVPFSGSIVVPGHAITFLALPGAANPACQ